MKKNSFMIVLLLILTLLAYSTGSVSASESQRFSLTQGESKLFHDENIKIELSAINPEGYNNVYVYPMRTVTVKISQIEPTPYINGEILVTFKSNIGNEQIQELVNQYNLKIKRYLPTPAIFPQTATVVVAIPSGKESEFINKLGSSSLVESVKYSEFSESSIIWGLSPKPEIEYYGIKLKLVGIEDNSADFEINFDEFGDNFKLDNDVKEHDKIQKVIINDGFLKKDFPKDPYDLDYMEIEGDILTMGIRYSGGCEEHEFNLVTTSFSFLEDEFIKSTPLWAHLYLSHDNKDDMCEAYPSVSLQFDLTPIKEKYYEFKRNNPAFASLIIDFADYDGNIHRLEYKLKEDDNSVTANSCEMIGLRSGGKYCSIDKVWLNQKGGNMICENNFECGSNVCVSGQCVAEDLLQRIINWFKKLFG